MDIARKHQKRIAYQTLRMTPAGARIMGGMNFEEAYEFIFKTNLRERLEGLIKEYGTGDLYSWELQTYGHDNPSELLNSL